MSRSANTIRVYSLYLFLMGAGLIAVPNVLLAIMGFEPTQEIWIRLLGLFTVTVGIYYFHCASHELTEFFKVTVVGRVFFFAATVVFVFLFNQSIMLAAIGSVDLLGAAWTYFALTKDKSK